MKNTVAIAVVLLIAIAAPAFADNVKVEVEISSNFDSSTLTLSNTYSTGGEDLVVTVAGKTCNLKGSARGSVPVGCNYTIKVAPDGSITGTLFEGPGTQVCTQSEDIPAACGE